MQALWPIVDVAMKAVVFLAVLTVLVAFHELGHFWAAKAQGMIVDEFSVMVGGLRRTDLTNGLKKPLMPSWVVWLAGAFGLGLFGAGLVVPQESLMLGGIVSGLVVVPIWVISRLGTLYHMKPIEWATTLLKVYFFAGLMLFVATKFQNLSLFGIAGLASAATFVALLIVYYRPVTGRPEDEGRHGYGQIVDSTTGQATEVRYRPLLSSRSKSGTEFALNLLPLGGFCLVRGAHIRSDGSETGIKGGLYNSTPWARFLMFGAGPLASLLLGVALFAALLTAVGENVPNNVPVLGKVMPDGPAAKAGLTEGDRVIEVNGKRVSTFYEILTVVSTSIEKRGEEYVGLPVRLKVARNGEEFAVTLVPKVTPTAVPVFTPELDLDPAKLERQGRMSVEIPHTVRAIGPVEALAKSASAPIALVAGLAEVVAKPAIAKESVGGPASIASQASDATDRGVTGVLSFAAGLSITLGIMNLLPFQPLDGGHMLVAILEMFRGGKRLDIRARNAMMTVGLFALVSIVALAWTLDIGRFVGKQ